MKQTHRLQKLHNPYLLFTLALCSTLFFSLFMIVNPASAYEVSNDTYTDNAGGKQNIRVTKADGNNNPAIIFIHGGGWVYDGGTYGPAFQDRAAKRGYTSFRIKYRLMTGGVEEQFKDVMNAIKHIRDNADKYGIDPDRVALWGDSAGGSLVVRAGASGKSGAAAVIGWSAPTNAFRDMFYTPIAFIDGIAHSRCMADYLPDWTMDVINFGSGNAKAFMDIANGNMPSPKEATRLLAETMNTLGIVIEGLPSIDGKLQQAQNDFGVTINKDALNNTSGSGSGSGSSSNSNDDSLTTSDGTKYTQEDVRKKLESLSDEELQELGLAIYQFKRSTTNVEDMTEDEKTTVSLMNMAAQEIEQTQSGIVQLKAIEEGQTTATDPQTGVPSLTGSGGLISIGDGDDAFLNINPQQISAEKLAQCMDDFVQLSPALFAAPNSPPMYLANASHEILVSPQDALQMRDKLRSMGIRSEAQIIPGTNHMGYDPKAEGPSFEFLDTELK